MQVNPSNSVSYVTGVQNKAPVKDARLDRDQVSFENVESLNNALQQTPDIRESEVARAKSLVDTSIYPPPEAIKRIANLLAIYINEGNPS